MGWCYCSAVPDRENTALLLSLTMDQSAGGRKDVTPHTALSSAFFAKKVYDVP